MAASPTKIAGVLHVERRALKRQPTEWRLVYAWEDGIREGRALDVSETGMRIETGIPFPVDSRLIAHAGSSEEPVLRKVEADVVWTRPSTKAGGLFESGCRFIAVAREIQENIRTLFALPDAERLAREPGDPLSGLEVPEKTPGAKTAGGPTEVADAEAFDPAALHRVFAREQTRREEHRRQAGLLLERARELMRAGDLKSSAEILLDGMIHLPDAEEILEELAGIRYRQGDVVEAARLFDRALRIKQEKPGG